mgnify:CR=1 FL=1
MCGRFQLSVKGKQISERFNVEVFDEMYSPSYNCAPSQKHAVITNDKPEELSFLKWGLIPFWSKEAAIGNKLINARAESILDKPAFKTAFSKRRCLIPANGFYEWRRDGKNKTAFRIFLKTDKLFAMAGIWDKWKGIEGREINTFSIITTQPNDIMKPIHNRMPVILNDYDEKAWLFENDTRYLQQLLQPFNKDLMQTYVISNRVNSPINNGPEIIEEYTNPQSSLGF